MRKFSQAKLSLLFEMSMAQKSTGLLSSLATYHSLVRIWALRLGIWVCLIWTSHSQALVILQYHHISDEGPESTRTAPALFRKHMRFLEENKFNVLSITALPRLLQEAKAGKPLPDSAVIITFDDGYRSIYNNAWPLLKARQWPFTIFVNSKPHDEKSPFYMSWDQLREVSRAGATIANHTDSHPYLLRRRGNETESQWRQRQLRELTFAEQRIRKEIGKVEKYFAYPYGEYSTDLQRMLAGRGYLGFGQQSGPLAGYLSAQALPRFPMGGAYGDMGEFQTKVYSLPFPSLQVIVQDESGRKLDQPELPAGASRPRLQLISPLLRFTQNGQCFASGQGEIPVDYRGGSLIAQAVHSLPVGRSRYNCTLAAGSGRYYWYSQLFIRRAGGGAWYRE